ncbi:HIT family protein [Streptomyces sp. NPDC057445]|uniref:HIT family protein n=1 Tax=Streptomyces sp. NPDC057445 TaxID=3346136 RepID=UPI0036C8E238
MRVTDSNVVTESEPEPETGERINLVAGKMRTALAAGGVNVLSAGGPGSEQSVPHLHFHVVPRWSDDGFSTWPSQQSQHEIAGDPVTQLADAMTASHAT